MRRNIFEGIYRYYTYVYTCHLELSLLCGGGGGLDALETALWPHPMSFTGHAGAVE